MKIAVLFSLGTEEIEALTPVDILRRAGAEVDVVSVSGEYPKGSHDIIVKADKLIENVDLNEYDALVIPGGMPGAKIISENAIAISGIKQAIESKKLIAAICASPAVVLGEHGLIGENKATCYPADVFVNVLGKNYTGANVEVCGNLITANGPKSAMEFSLAICKKLNLTPKF